jgi:hypothetical protein
MRCAAGSRAVQAAASSSCGRTVLEPTRVLAMNQRQMHAKGALSRMIHATAIGARGRFTTRSTGIRLVKYQTQNVSLDARVADASRRWCASSDDSTADFARALTKSPSHIIVYCSYSHHSQAWLSGKANGAKSHLWHLLPRGPRPSPSAPPPAPVSSAANAHPPLICRASNTFTATPPYGKTLIRPAMCRTARRRPSTLQTVCGKCCGFVGARHSAPASS